MIDFKMKLRFVFFFILYLNCVFYLLKPYINNNNNDCYYFTYFLETEKK